MTRRPLPIARLDPQLTPTGGLTQVAAEERRQRYGTNDIVEEVGHPWWDLARDTAQDPMLWFLVGTGAIYAIVGEWIEALTLLGALVPIIGMDAWLHRRTRASTSSLQTRLAAHATVLRDGTPVEVPARDLVPGDLVLVAAGQPFPADGVVMDGADMQVDESTLTGEAFPIRKRVLPTLPRDGGEPAVAHEHWGFAGTRLLTGRASLRVVFTGGETLYGEIVHSVAAGIHAKTPLQTAIAGLVTVLISAAAVVCLMLAFVRLRQGYGWVDALVSAVTLAVAAIPEEFPVVFTFFLGVGVFRLAQREALVRRAVTVENIGRTSCICSDKTGTITEGRLELTHLVPAEEGGAAHLLRLAALASRSETGDPLDAAILHAADADGVTGPRPETVATFPFTEDRKRETVVARDADGRLLAATKGASELILSMTQLDGAEREAWSRRVIEYAADGHKVIGCAWRPLDEWAGGEPDRGYRFAGFLACEDPVREGVTDAIAQCHAGGIHVIMVTGDHPVTARAVAREIGLGAEPRVICGDDLEAHIRRHESGRALEIDVIARAVPAQKLELVRALQAAGEIVAVTGDGVNDVPALQAADIGIAMGERGTRSAREAAAIVLLNDNFRTIVRAIAEGRQLFRNLQLSFHYLLMIHLPLVVTAALIPLAGYPLLYLPIHIVWLELIIHPTAMLGFQEGPDRSGLARRREPRAVRFFQRREWAVIAFVGTLLTAIVVGGYARSLGGGRNVEHARAMAMVTLTLASAMLGATMNRLRTPAARFIAAGTVGLSLLLVQTPSLASLLHMQPLHLDDWLAALAGVLLTAGIPMLSTWTRIGRPER